MFQEESKKKSDDKSHYIDKKDFFIEIVVSKARGNLTLKAQHMFNTLAERVIRKMRYYNPDDRKDCLQTGLFNMYDNWQNFNEEKYANVFAYFTEIMKRGMAEGFNELTRMKGQPRDKKVRFISFQGANDGEGLHNI